MAVTMEKINKTNAKLSNGFRVDVMQAMRGDKYFVKDFVMPDGRNATASVYYLSPMNWDTGKRETFAVVNFNYYTLSDNKAFKITHGLGWTMKLQNTPVTRKTEKLLVDFTKELDDESCINWMSGFVRTRENPMA